MASDPHIPHQDDHLNSGPSGAEKASEMYSMNYLQQVIDKSQTGIFLFTPVKDKDGVVQDFIFTMANDKLASYVGQTKETVTGSLGSTYFAGYKTNGLFELYSDTYYTGKQNHFEFHYNTDGVDAWLDIMSTKLNDEVLVTFSDHTTLKQLQQQHEGMIEELSRSNADLEQFAYIASHDLQEPLRKIQAFGEMLKNRYGQQLDDYGNDMINRMQNASERMKTLIDDLLTYSRVSSQKRSFKPVDLNEVLKDILSDMETTIRNEKAVLHIAKLQPVSGDRVQLTQLFQNLISNAIKFKKPDSQPEITISSAVIHPSFVKNITLPDPKSNYQHITVEDKGIGFEPEYSERIFQIFQRLHGRSDYPGTGVGLSIVRKVAEQHKGAIIGVGTPDAGAVFHVYLPLESEAANGNQAG